MSILADQFWLTAFNGHGFTCKVLVNICLLRYRQLKKSWVTNSGADYCQGFERERLALKSSKAIHRPD